MIQPTCLHHMIVRIDEHINAQINAIIHHSMFQQLEARWRALHHLTTHSHQPYPVQLKILPLSAHELHQDLTVTHADVTHTALFQRMINEAIDQPGADPFSCMVVDFSFHHQVDPDFDSVSILTELSYIGAAAFCPMLCTAAPALFHLDTWSDLNTRILKQVDYLRPEYHRWMRLSEQSTSQFLVLTAVRARLRDAYHRGDFRTRNHFFTETIPTHDEILWASSSYLYASAIIAAFQQTGWFLSMQRTHTLPPHYAACYTTETQRSQERHTLTECYITDPIEHALNHVGITCIRDHKHSDVAAIHTHTTFYRPKPHIDLATRASRQLNCQLHHVLCAARFAQMMKIVLRDHTGRFQQGIEAEQWLQQWILPYCSANHDSDIVRYPLKGGRIRVTDSPHQPGNYFCQFELQPHTLLADINATIQLNSYFHHHAGQRHEHQHH